MTTAADTALQAIGISPSITVNDLDASIRFYEGLGFGIDERWENEGRLVGVMMRAGQALIGLTQDDWQKGRDRVKGVGLRLYIATEQDIDQLAERAKSTGVRLDAEAHDAPWGSRVFEVTDPDGFKLTVAKEA
jgi:uncharacterized glyoxalase superfamily protein PhnB